MSKFKAKVQVDNSLERYYPKQVNMQMFYYTYYQINDVLSLDPIRVLIIGGGTNFEKYYFEKRGVEVKTLDIDPVLDPDYLISVTDIKEIGFEDKEFDVILASHVLEHIPFEYVDEVLREFARISRYSVIHLPIAQARFGLKFYIWFIGEIIFNLDLPIFFWKKHKFNGEHYWELGTKGYSLGFMKKVFSKYFDILKSYKNKYHHYSYNYVLKSKM